VVRPGGFELPTFWFVAVGARGINKLHGKRRIATECYKYNEALGLGIGRSQQVALGGVRWWAQNWAQFTWGEPLE